MDQQPKQPEGGKEPMRLIINDLQVNNAKVVLRPGIPGLSNEIQVPIPSFALKDIGRGEARRTARPSRSRHAAGDDDGGEAESDQVPPEDPAAAQGRRTGDREGDGGELRREARRGDHEKSQGRAGAK